MIDVAKAEGRQGILKSLWNTYHCGSKAYTFENRYYTKYCKNRFCTTCLGIRKAEMIRLYYSIIKEWKDPHFVTLTVKAQPKYMLNTMFEKCIEGLQLIIDRNRKKFERGTGIKLMGIRSLECNFNPRAYTYNPHFHLIVPDLETADVLRDEWLKQWKYKDNKRKPLANKKGQKISRIKNLEQQLIETVKYSTKVFTDPKDNKSEKRNPNIYARAFYNIVKAMYGKRMFASFGFTLPKDNKERIPARVVDDYEEWIYLPEYFDWQHIESEQLLFGYLPNAVLKELLENHIDTIKE